MTKRTSEQMVADLEAKIAAVKARDERKRAKADPTLLPTIKAVKAIDVALGAATDGELHAALEDARQRLVALPQIAKVLPAAKEPVLAAPRRSKLARLGKG